MRLFRSAGVGVALACATACHRAPPGPPRNVLLVTLDTVRADRIGCYGRKDADTPILDGLAKRGARFADATAAAPVTLPSHASILTGLDGTRHGVRDNGLFALSPQVVTLAERLQGAGFATGAFVGSVVLARRHGLDQGFDVYSEPSATQGAATFELAERPAEEVNRDALAWLASVPAGRPFFAWVHYMEAHAPYDPPEPEKSRHRDDPYQGEIAHDDRLLGELLDGLASRGRLDGTLVVVIADHGEDLGDHGEGTHGLFLYQSTLHVPFVAAGPGVRSDVVIDAPVSGVDVTPTILDALRQPAASPCDGQSLWPALATGAALPADRALYAETFLPRFDYGFSELRALRNGSSKYVHAPRAELYDVKADPGERTNLIASDHATAERLESTLVRRATREQASGLSAVDVTVSPQEEEALASLGYQSGAARGTAPAGAALPDPKDKVADTLDLDRADDRLRQGDAAGAVTSLRAILARSPDLVEARVSLLTALLVSGDTAGAEAEAKELIARAQQLPQGARVAARAHVALAEMDAASERFTESATEWDAAFAVPQAASAYVESADALDHAGRRADAIRRLEELQARGEMSPAATDLLTRLRAAPPAPPARQVDRHDTASSGGSP